MIASLVRWLNDRLDRAAWPAVCAVPFCAALGLKEIALPFWLVTGAGVCLLIWAARAGEDGLRAAYYGLVAYIPFSRLLTGGESGALLSGSVLAVCLMGGFIARDRRRARVVWDPNDPAWVGIAVFGALTLWSLVRARWMYGADYVGDQGVLFARWLAPLLLYPLTRAAVRDERTVHTTLLIVLWSVGAVGGMAAWDYLGSADDGFEESRVGGIAEHPNMLGAFFVSYMFLFAGLLLRTKIGSPIFWIAAAALAVSLRGVMVTFSRGAYLAAAAGAMSLCWFRSKRLFALAALAIILVVANPQWLPGGVRYRMGMTLSDRGGEFAESGDVTEHLETSAGARIVIWRGALRMIQDHPWTGIGLGAFEPFLPQYTEGRIGYMNAHNSFLMIAGELGLPALAAFVALLAWTGWLAWRVVRLGGDELTGALGLGLLGGLVAFVVANSFSVCLDPFEVVGYLWVLAGLASQAPRVS